KERATIVIPEYAWFPFFHLAFTADSNTLISAIWTFQERGAGGDLSVRHWDLATGKARATFWPLNPVKTWGSSNADMPYAVLSADGKTVAWGGVEGPTGSAHVWEVGSLARKVPEMPKEAEKPGDARKEETIKALTILLIDADT